LLEWTLAAISASDLVENIILVTPPDDLGKMSDIYLNNMSLPKVSLVIAGGEKRGDSVYNGILRATSDYVLIHDAARPFVTTQVIERTVEAARAHGCATAALPAHDTVKIRDGEFLGTLVDRSTLLLIQTPQVFKRQTLLKAYEIHKNKNADWTDETSLVQNAGFSVAWIPGENVNFKITTPADFQLAEAIAHFAVSSR